MHKKYPTSKLSMASFLNNLTLFGLPPKVAMYSLTYVKAAIWSDSP